MLRKGQFVFFLICFVQIIICSCVSFGSFAQTSIATKGYVDRVVTNIQADWEQNNPDSNDYIKNKPENIQTTDNMATELKGVSENKYPSVSAVNSALDDKADKDDIRFNTVSTSQPVGTPPTGQVFIWFSKE